MNTLYSFSCLMQWEEMLLKNSRELLSVYDHCVILNEIFGLNSNPYSLTEIRIPIGHVDFTASIFRLFLALNMLRQSIRIISKIIFHEKTFKHSLKHFSS